MNLDPYHTQSAWVRLPTGELGLGSGPESAYQVHDLIGDARYLWHGESNFVKIDPSASPAHVFRVRRKVKTERDFDYYCVTAPGRAGRGRPATMSLLTDFDLYLLAEGTHTRAYEKFGAHLVDRNGTAGTDFAVWAPNARCVSVIGDFNGWNPRADPLQARGETGIWERFVPGVGPGALYKYAITSRVDDYHVDKADPYGFAAEVRPRTASVVADLDALRLGRRRAGWPGRRGPERRHRADLHL